MGRQSYGRPISRVWDMCEMGQSRVPVQVETVRGSCGPVTARQRRGFELVTASLSH